MRGSKIRKLSAALALLPAVLVAQQVSVPDTIYINGSVITMDGARIVQAVAVRGDRIAATGTSEAIRKMAGPATTIVDLKGATMLPGLIDPHSHFPGSGTSALFSVDLSGPPVGTVDSIDALVAALHKKALATPKGEWIRGHGYDQTLLKEGVHPTRYDLDRASTDHPIFGSAQESDRDVTDKLS